MANTFLASKNINIGSSLYEKTMLKVAVNFLNDFKEKILLPDDVFVKINQKRFTLEMLTRYLRKKKF